MFGSLGPMELMIIFIIILIVFGADRLPDLARGLGKGIREFKRAADDVKREIMIDTDIDLDLNEPLASEPPDTKDPYSEEWEDFPSDSTTTPEEHINDPRQRTAEEKMNSEKQNPEPPPGENQSDDPETKKPSPKKKKPLSG